MASRNDHTQSGCARRLVFGFCALLALICLGSAGIGVYEVVEQQRLVASYSAETTAVVLSKRLERHQYDTYVGPGGGPSQTVHVYTPIVTFRYEVDGREFTSDKVFPDATAKFEFHIAQPLLDRFEVGKSTTAYYDPDNPADACLIRRPLLDHPYTVILTCIVIVGSVVGVFWQPSPSADVMFRRRKGRWIAVVWHSIGLLACGQYISNAEMNGSTLLLFGFYTQLGLIPVCSALPSAKGGSIVNRFKVAVGFSLAGTAFGFLLGLGVAWVATTVFSASPNAFLQIWGSSIAIGAILLFSLGAALGSD